MADADFETTFAERAVVDADPLLNAASIGALTSLKASIRDGAKRLSDIVGAILLAVVFAPLIIAIVVVIRRGGGDVFFPHERVGLNGRSFRCYKFRTMVPDAEQRLKALLDSDSALAAEWQEVRKLRNDPRITPIGRFLRRTSLDELPQIWNVLVGEMSLVGPRPIVRDELHRYGRNLGTYLGAKPGLTGLWQVTGRSDASYRRRVAMDVYYARNRSLLLDLSILLKTVRVVVAGNGAY